MLACILAAFAAAPQPHGAVARVLAPTGAARQALAAGAASRGVAVEAHGASRVLALRHAAASPAGALRELGELAAGLQAHGVLLVDEPRPEAPSLARAGCAGGAALLLSGWIASFLGRRRVPERSVVREAVLLAQRGHETLLVQRGARFRVVIVDGRADRADLQVLTRLSGGAPIFARHSGLR